MTTSFNEVKKKEVVVKLNYSSINQKDYLVTRGKFWGIRNFPLITGIDGSGIIVYSKSKKFKVGDKVSVVASLAGSFEQGCYSKFLKIKDKWLSKLPRNLTSKQSMIFGTAGFTAMYIVKEILKIKKLDKPILVTGANGGVGTFLIYLLSKHKFKVIACSRNKSYKNYLLKLGAKKFIPLSEITKNTNFPLLKISYGACIDTIGGIATGEILKQLENNSILYSVGYSEKKSISKIDLTPFILRRVKLFGIHVESLKSSERDKVWKMIANFVNKNNLTKNLYKEIKFSSLPKKLKSFNKSNKEGRLIIKI